MDVKSRAFIVNVVNFKSDVQVHMPDFGEHLKHLKFKVACITKTIVHFCPIGLW